ncbi:MAG: hypothetical protein L0206_25380, partial [Actinobacteria bacterium]|nr:hypothetical protein [Actinomycetota bacterium]
KASLIASADFMTGANLTRLFRGNNEQGYGRVQLTNVLPLEAYPPAVTGLITADGGIAGGVNHTSFPGTINAVAGATQNATFEVCDETQEIRVALAWVETSGQALINDLDLEVVSPDPPGPDLPRTYVGNYFTDDNDRDLALDAGEDCPGFDGLTGTITSSPWSIPRCANTPTDTRNPTEAIMLSPDPDGDEDTADGLSQTVPGTWTVTIKAKPGGADSSQRYALIISGGVCLGSSVRFDRGTYTCNGKAGITVSELIEATDPTPSASEVGTRTTIEVLDGTSGLVVDTETGTKLGFNQPAAGMLRFESNPIVVSSRTARQPGNAVLDVQDGDRLRVAYQDEDNDIA